MIDLTEYNTKLEASKTEDGLYHYVIELTTDDGGTYNTLVNKHMEPDEITALFESIKDTHQIDLDWIESDPRFMLMV